MTDAHFEMICKFTDDPGSGECEAHARIHIKPKDGPGPTVTQLEAMRKTANSAFDVAIQCAKDEEAGLQRN